MKGYRVDPHVHVKLANCFRAVDNPDACDKAVSYYRKSIDHEGKVLQQNTPEEGMEGGIHWSQDVLSIFETMEEGEEKDKEMETIKRFI